MTIGKLSLRGLEIIVTHRGANIDRIVNLRAILRHLDRTYVDYALWLIEADRASTFHWNELADEKVRHVFVPDGGLFSRAKLCNIGVRLTRSPVVCFHDADMVAHPAALKFCLDDLLDKDGADAWGPFQRVVNVAGELRTRFAETGDYLLLDPYSEPEAPYAPDMGQLYLTNGSGIVLMRRATFHHLGGFDESFVGWGGEDDDILVRAHRLNVRWYSLLAKRLFHLNHDSPTRDGWDKTPIGAANCQMAIDRQSMDDAAFSAHLEQLRARL
jgi:hypothetical protein